MLVKEADRSPTKKSKGLGNVEKTLKNGVGQLPGGLEGHRAPRPVSPVFLAFRPKSMK